jgi:predicted Zn-dependent protease
MRLTQTLIAGSITVGLGALSGCATPVHMSPTVAAAAKEQAGREIRTADNWVPQYLSEEDAERKVLDIYGRLLPGATKLCRELGEDECAWDIRYSSDQDVNAFAAGESTVVIKKGILRHAENDDEIAMVIAHEMSHHAANHIAESQQNAAAGALVGGLVLGALAGAAYSGSYYSQYYVNDAVQTGLNAGAAIGHRSFSKGQENEADYLAAYILHQGGFDLGQARRMWVKLGRLGTTEHGERHSMNTHPDPAERLARWDATIHEIRANGGVLPSPSPERRSNADNDARNPFKS